MWAPREDRFFAYVRAFPPLGPKLIKSEVDGCNRILGRCADADLSVAQAAYVLATAYHETAGTLMPLREYGQGRGKKYGRPGKHGGQVAYGRGDVQLTWDYNYERADRELGLNGALLDDYDLALDPFVSAQILVRGMEEGWFTGVSLTKKLPGAGAASRAMFNGARTIVNGYDKADLIAGYAVTFQNGLQQAGWDHAAHVA